MSADGFALTSRGETRQDPAAPQQSRDQVREQIREQRDQIRQQIDAQRDAIREQVRAQVEAARARSELDRGGRQTVMVQPMPPMPPFSNGPPEGVVMISIAFFVAAAFVIVGLPLVRAFARRMDRRSFPSAVTGDTTAHAFAGAGAPAGYEDGPARQARFSEPGGLCLARRQLFVADTNNHAVRVIDLASPSREVRTLDVDESRRAH